MKVIVVAVALCASQAIAEARDISASTDGQTRIQLASNPELCRQLRERYQICEQNWRNIGGGNSGQAQAFKDCMDTYRQAGVAAGCWR
jgi:hypothetical protein